MYAQLGDVRYLNRYFIGIDGTRSANFPEHPRAGGKPRLQKNGLNLETLTIRMGFDHLLTNPETQIAALDAMLAKQEPVPLLYGNGRVRGVYVILEISDTVLETDAAGGVLRAEVTVSLKEDGENDPAAAANRKAKANAAALAPNVKPGASVPAVKLKPPTPTAAAATAKQALSGAARAQKVASLAVKAALDPSKRAALAKEAARIDPALAPVAAAAETGLAVYAGLAGAKATIARMRELGPIIKGASIAGDASTLKTASAELASLERHLRTASAGLVGAAATRRA